MTTFSSSYFRTMRGMIFNTPVSVLNPNIYNPCGRQQTEYSVLLTYKVKVNSPEFPLSLIPYGEDMLRLYLRQNEHPKDVWFFEPLGVYRNYDTLATTDAVFRTFNNYSSYGRLIKVTTKGGQVYYGNRGMVLDKDFHPLFFVTVKKLHRDYGYKIYLSPEVFVNTTDPVCKALAKKAMSFYLDPRYITPQPEIIIKDVSEYFSHAHRDSAPVDSIAIRSFLINNFYLIDSQIRKDYGDCS